jgi:hypothetical protein
MRFSANHQEAAVACYSPSKLPSNEFHLAKPVNVIDGLRSYLQA